MDTASEPLTKKSTAQSSAAQINRENFERARKIFFGTERIPGTDRERWTTAGIFNKNKATLDMHFQLGPYTFKLVAGNGYDWNSVFVQVRLPGTDDIYISIARLYGKTETMLRGVHFNKISQRFVVENSFYLDDDKKPPTLFIKNGKLYLNHHWYSENSNTLSSQEVWTNVAGIEDVDRVQTDYTAFLEQSSFTKLKVSGDPILLSIRGRGEANFTWKVNPSNLQRGMNVIDSKTVILFHDEISRGFDLFFATQVEPNSVIYRRKSSGKFLQYEENFCVEEDFDFVNQAISWLMHVLTGPDPRTFDSKFLSKDELIQMKESVAPTKNYFVNENGMVKKRTTVDAVDFRELVFFAGVKDETANAYEIYAKVVEFLQGYGAGNFAENLARLYDSKSNIRRALLQQHNLTFADFKQAQERISRYQQYEFMGCSMCGKNEIVGKCGGSCKKKFCGDECHVVAHMQSKCRI